LIQEVIKDNFIKNPNYNPFLEQKKSFHQMTNEEKLLAIQSDKRCGNIICKCEKVTEKEIISAIHHTIPTDTVKGIRKRARAGSGLCQGGYCEGLVLKIISKETNQPLNKINYYNKNTPILLDETK